MSTTTQNQTQPNTQVQEQKPIIEVSYTATRFTRTYSYSMIFSLKQRRFVKPVRFKHLALWYKLLPGTYMRLSSDGRNDDAVQEVIVEIIRINNDASEDVVKETKWIVFLNGDMAGCPEIIKDFVRGRPELFHRPPEIDFTKTYASEDIQRTLEGGTCGPTSQ